MRQETFQPGDIYEDCAFHPCLCVKVDGDSISGISLIDGSSPRLCSLAHCGVRKLSLEEAMIWKTQGPQDIPEGCEITADRQWWWPKPPQGINPGLWVEFFFESSLRFVRTFLRQQLGDGIAGWSESAAEFDDYSSELGRYAKASYSVTGSKASARVSLEAEREGRQWPIRKISVLIDGENLPLVFEGEAVRGCGHAG